MAIENVRIPRGANTIGGLSASPRGQGPFPGVIMIPTIRALDEFARDVVGRLAAENFVALAVNIRGFRKISSNGRALSPMTRSLAISMQRSLS